MNKNLQSFSGLKEKDWQDLTPAKVKEMITTGCICP